MNKYVIGIDVGGTKVAYGLFDDKRNLLTEHRHDSDTNLTSEEFFDFITDTIFDICKTQKISINDLLGIGVAWPSMIDSETGQILITSNLVKVSNFPAIEYLSKKFDNKVKIGLCNDAHVAAIAEHRFGAGRGFDHILFCPVSTGISSAMIINGELFRGTYGFSGESGHGIATPGFGIMCGCGNRGCFMSWTSGSMVPKHVQNWIAEGEETIMTTYVDDPKKLTMEHIDRAFTENDPLAIRAVEQMVIFLSVWIYNLYILLNINCFVFGGGLLSMNARILERVRVEFDKFNVCSDKPVYFKTAELGSKAGIIGASELIF